jgi:hypothetical protein
VVTQDAPAVVTALGHFRGRASSSTTGRSSTRATST